MDSPVLLKNRYEIKDVLGRGGMGVVYQAFDTLMQRDVALKTLHDLANQVFVDLFCRECSVLAAIVHPNIVEIFDMGEFEDEGVLKPYFVMPLLPGRTLYDLIYPAGTPLAPERCADIIGQACRGLHAAHECGLLHRDLKPRNIFVMRDDAVKLIDFGVGRLLGGQTNGGPGAFGTLNYMAPEQIAMQELTARSDIFSLATVCYEALTAVHPFVRDNDTETAAAVTEHEPPLVSSLNPLVSKTLAQVIAQAMAKEPAQRFESAAAFGDALQRAVRHERSGLVLLNNPQNRLARARRSFARADYEFTGEILDQLEAEGVIDPEIRELRAQVNDAVRKREAELQLAAARRYFQEEEYALALRRVADVLAASPSDPAAVSLKNQIERKLNEQRAADSTARASEHLELGEFVEARRVLEDLMTRQPNLAEAKRLLAETTQRERDWPRERQAQQALFETARKAYASGLLEVAYGSLKELMELTQRSKAAGARLPEYREFHRSVRAEYEVFQATLTDARKLLANGDLAGAGFVTESLRERYENDDAVRALSDDLASRRLAHEEQYRAEIRQRTAQEPDLTNQLQIWNEAARSRPSDDYFQAEAERVQATLDQVAEQAKQAQLYEDSAKFDHALEEWLCVRDSYPAYPGLTEHLARVRGLWETQRAASFADLASVIAEAWQKGDQQGAEQLLSDAHAEFHGEARYTQLCEQVQAAAESHREVAAQLADIQKAEGARDFSDIPSLFDKALTAGKEIRPLRVRIYAAMTEVALRVLPQDWKIARQLAEELGRGAVVPPELSEAIRREEQEEEVGNLLAEGRGGLADLAAYHERVANLLGRYPDEARLQERLSRLEDALAEKRKQDEKNACAASLVSLTGELAEATDHHILWNARARAKGLAAPFPQEPAIASLVDDIGEQVALFESAAEHLSRDHMDDCFALCDRALAAHPGHRLFLQLRAQALQRQRELGEDYFDRVERWLASEPDLFGRRQILERAQAQFPFDTRYAEELQHLERQQALAESLAVRAADFEKRGLIGEALGQWRQLRNIHDSYPGLEERIAACESIIERQQRKARAQRLFAQGQAHFADGEFDQGYEMLADAARNGEDIPELLRPIAPELVATARIVLADSPKLAEALVALAQRVDEELLIPPDFLARIGEARQKEHLAECLSAIHAHEESGDFSAAVALANEFLAEFPGVKEVEYVRDRAAAEIARARQEQLRTQALADLRELERRAAQADFAELRSMQAAPAEIASRAPEDEEVRQQASTLSVVVSALADAKEQLQKGAPGRADEICVAALEEVPQHPLLNAARAEASQLQAELTAKSLADVKERLASERDFSKQAAILEEARAQFPNEPFFEQEHASLKSKQQELADLVENARALEAKQSLGEAIREWELLRQRYPWYEGAEAELERLASARRKEKQEAHERWFQQVDAAIANADYETASTMIRQAEQQQPDRALQALDQKLKEALEKREAADTQFTEGKRLLANGELAGGGKALYRAYELQPGDKEKTNSIVLLLQMQIRAHVMDNLVACGELLSLLNRIQPGHVLPPDLSEALSKKQKAVDAGLELARKLKEQIAALAKEAEGARSKKALNSIADKIYESGQLNSTEPESRRAAADLLHKVELRLAEIEKPQPARGHARTMTALATAALVAVMVAAAAVLMLRLRERTVPVHVSVIPDHSSIEIGGHECQTPECTFQLKPGQYVVHIQKAGYKPRSVLVSVKSGDATPLKLNAALEPLIAPVREVDALARIEIRGALPLTRISLDGDDIGAASADGTFLLRVRPGAHILDLSLKGFRNRTIKRDFARGETVLLVDAAVRLKPQSRLVP